MRRHRLLWQLIPSYWLVIAAMLALVILYIMGELRDFSYNQAESDLVARAQLLEDRFTHLLSQQQNAASTMKSSDVDKQCKAFGRGTKTRITIILPNGKVVADSDQSPKVMENHADRAEVIEAMAQGVGRSVRHSDTLDKDMMYVAIPLKQQGKTIGVLRTSISVSQIDQQIHGIVGRMIVGGLLIALLAAVVSLFVSRRICTPLEEIKEGAERFARGDFSQQLPTCTTSEIAALAETMNQMADELDARFVAMERQKDIRSDFVANVSHELKTPVTSIKGFAETLNDGTSHAPEDVARFLGIIAAQAQRMHAIIEDGLLLSRLEQEPQQDTLPLEVAPLRDVIESAIEVCILAIEKKKITMQFDCDEAVRAKVNAPLLIQAVVNLIDNAVKYSPIERTVHIAVTTTEEETLIQVRDHGTGIGEEHLSRIFERFYRVDKARSREVGGTGLGLSIVKHIAQLHGGTATVESRMGEGSTFTIHLPLLSER